MIAAVLTAYKPDADFVARFAPLLSVCSLIVVSDNTPGGFAGLQLPHGFTVIHNLENIGLGPALNIGIAEARRQGARRIILFDQDSSPSPEFVCEMFSQLNFAVAQFGAKCCLGPTHVDDQVRKLTDVSDTDSKFSVGTLSYRSWQEVVCLPTSGMVFQVDALQPDNGFAEDLFLDLVDFEWCWRLRHGGWLFLRTSSLWMYHRLGESERRFLGVTFHVPAPYRHYFQVRDTLRLSCRAYVPTYSKLRLVSVLPVKFFVYPFLLKNGLERLRWMLLGIRDSIRGVRGVGAASERLLR